MILYFSGTGNSEYAARRIAQALGDEAVSLFERIKTGDVSPLLSQRPWVLAVPTYAWRIPRIVEEWLERARLEGSREIWFVLTCGDSIGNAAAYAQALCDRKGLRYRGCMGITMPENYIALFQTPDREQALQIIRRAEGGIDRAAEFIRRGEPFPKARATAAGRLCSGPVNRLFYPMFVHAGKFYVTDACISCGQCARVCPLTNVRLEGGRPVWGDRCTHCMACICRCPAQAIEYGRHSRGLPRYVCPKQGAV